jgi:hypothetical protein
LKWKINCPSSVTATDNEVRGLQVAGATVFYFLGFYMIMALAEVPKPAPHWSVARPTRSAAEQRRTTSGVDGEQLSMHGSNASFGFSTWLG